MTDAPPLHTKRAIGKRPALSSYLKKLLTGWRPDRKPGDRAPAFAALYVAGPAHPVSKRIGDNRGCWPIKFGVTQAWQDQITNMLDGSAPLYWQGMLFRVWCSTPTSAQLLESLVRSDLPDDWEPLRKAWVDFGPELDVTALEKAIRRIATDHNIRTWNDVELVKHLKSIEDQPRQKLTRMRQSAALR